MFNLQAVDSKGTTSCGHSIENAIMDYRRASAVCTVCGQEISGMDHTFYGYTMNDYSRVGAYDESAWKNCKLKQRSRNVVSCCDDTLQQTVEVPKIKISSEEKRRIQTFEHIDVIVNGLRLTDESVELARMYYEKIESTNCKKCKKVSLLAAACISLVIKTRRMNISFKELSTFCENVKTKEIMRLNHAYSKLLSLKKHYVSLSDTISKYASIFCLDFHQEKFAFSLSEFIQTYEIIPGNNPFSCISVIMYCTCSLVEPSKTKSISNKRAAVNWKNRMLKYDKPYDQLYKIISQKLDISINTIRKSMIIFKKHVDRFFNKRIMKQYAITKFDLKTLFD